MRLRRHRFQSLKQAGADMRNLYKTGLDQENHDCTEVVCLTNSELVQSQNIFLSTVGPRSPTWS